MHVTFIIVIVILQVQATCTSLYHDSHKPTTMPMVFHSRHSGTPIIMDDGQIVQKVSESNGKDMPAETITRMENGDNRLVKARPAPEDVKKEEESGQKIGLLDSRPLCILALWYFFSAITLFLNKYLIVMIKTDTILLGESTFMSFK